MQFFQTPIFFFSYKFIQIRFHFLSSPATPSQSSSFHHPNTSFPILLPHSPLSTPFPAHANTSLSIPPSPPQSLLHFYNHQHRHTSLHPIQSENCKFNHVLIDSSYSWIYVCECTLESSTCNLLPIHWEKYMFMMAMSGPNGKYFPIYNKRILLITIKQSITKERSERIPC